MRVCRCLQVIAGLAAAACSPHPILPPPGPPATAPYVIRAGDLLDVRFYKTPELNLKKIPVRADGMISLELVGDVKAAGETPAALTSVLTQRYAAELDHPRVAVIVSRFGGQVYVGGEVKSPSAQPLADGLTALQAITMAGGFLDTARRDSVVLIRQENGQYHGYILALGHVLGREDFQQDVRLQATDVLHVPKSPVANVNLFVQQYIRNNLPVVPALPVF